MVIVVLAVGRGPPPIRRAEDEGTAEALHHLGDLWCRRLWVLKGWGRGGDDAAQYWLTRLTDIDWLPQSDNETMIDGGAVPVAGAYSIALVLVVYVWLS